MLDCDRSKISRIEAGERGIRREDLTKLLAEYGIGEEQQAILTELADPRGAFGWHRDYADILPDPIRDYAILETAAWKISAYEAQRVPVLLQTPAYASDGQGLLAARRRGRLGSGGRSGACPSAGDCR
jgi:hypothetical protein